MRDFLRSALPCPLSLLTLQQSSLGTVHCSNPIVVCQTPEFLVVHVVPQGSVLCCVTVESYYSGRCFVFQTLLDDALVVHISFDVVIRLELFNQTYEFTVLYTNVWSGLRTK